MSDGPSSIPGLVLVGTGKGVVLGGGASTRVVAKAGILSLLVNGTLFEDNGVCVGPGIS